MRERTQIRPRAPAATREDTMTDTATKKKHPVLKRIAIALLCIIVVLAIAAAAIISQFCGKIASTERLDDQGYLYKVEYSGSYDNPLYKIPIRLLQSNSCSTFAFRNEEGDAVTARNFDYPHGDADGNTTGLNFVVELSPEGKYRSINAGDIALLQVLDKSFVGGALDTGAQNSPLMALLPYLCMDGMNEKGLVCSIMYLDIRDGEKATSQNDPGKDDVIITELLRYALDTCATTDEVIELAGSYNMHGILGGNYHLLVNDAAGKSVVLEWQDNELVVVESDAATNFYLSSDDAQDSYANGQLRETWTGPADTLKAYCYGYGHGYERFKTVVAALDEHRASADEPAVMTQEEARAVLQSVAQTYVKDLPTSMTQYSAIYNATDLTLDLWVQQDYEKEYSFSLAD